VLPPPINEILIVYRRNQENIVERIYHGFPPAPFPKRLSNAACPAYRCTFTGFTYFPVCTRALKMIYGEYPAAIYTMEVSAAIYILFCIFLNWATGCPIGPVDSLLRK